MMDRRIRYYRVLFGVAAAYDIVLGVAFTLFHAQVFDLLEIGEPPRGGYLTLIGAFLFVIGIAYVLLARGDLVRNRDLILVGTLYKLAYSAVAFATWASGDLPHVSFVAVFGVADIAFFVLMLECYVWTSRTSSVEGRRAYASGDG